MFPIENSSPSGLCELRSHCLYELNVDTRDVSVIAGKLDDDGPVETTTFSSPSGLASRREVLYITEHPLNQQGAVRFVFIVRACKLPEYLAWAISFSGKGSQNACHER